MDWKRRKHWPSKIGSVPGPIVVVKGYPRSDPPIGKVIEYKPLRYSYRSRESLKFVNDYEPWSRGIVTRYVHNTICIDRL